MAIGTDPRSPLAALSANLCAETKQQRKALARLQTMLGLSRLGDGLAGSVARELSVERASWDVPAGEVQGRERLAAAEAGEVPQFRVFRREAPLAAPTLDLTTPAWGRGAAVAETLGPFPSLDGRLFWFDFFPLVRLVPVYLEGEAQPAMLFHLRQLRLGLGDPLLDPLLIDEALRFLQRRRYQLGRSSFWIRADLLSSGAPAGTYVGLRITGGQLVFTPPPIDMAGKLTIPAGGRCAVQLDLEAPAVPAAGGGQAGIDDASSELTLPVTFSFTLAAGHDTVTQLGEASWTLYGQRIDFNRRPGPAPTYEPQLLSVLIPLSASVPEIEIGVPESPFAAVAGRARIHRAGWALPVATIDVANPIEAAGIGGLAVQTDAGLTLDWRGLREGPVRLPSPWIALAPGLLLITDTHAANRYAHQTLRLWKDEDSRFRSTLALRYSDSFAVTYAVAAAGSEVLAAQTSAEARLDRPVDVKGVPLPIHTLGSLLVLSFTDDTQLAFLYDDNILVDSLDPKAIWPLKNDRPLSLAIRNALFTVTPVNSLLLFARLRDEEVVERGTLMLGMGLYALLPTLPDPYAANVGWLRRQGRGPNFERRVSLLLVAAVTWTKAALDEDPDTVDTRFAFAPLAPQEALAAWTSNAGSAGPLDEQRSTLFSSQESNQAIWDRYFQRFGNEQFALLDVSSNADQMGVSFAWFNPREVNDRDQVFYKVYGGNAPALTSAYPLQVRDLDLTAESRFVRAFTVPQISWEPLVNLTAPAIGGDPPGGFNLYPDDGGPTRLLNDSVELVPIAPIPVTEFLVRDFEERQPGFTGALFTLPFGLRAFAEFSRQNQFNLALGGAKLRFNRPEYDGDVRGGLQLQADAPRHPAESPIFKGSTLQIDNVRFPDGTDAHAGTLGHSVAFIFNKEFFFDGNTGYKDRGVPVTRIDFSGYGASLFSHWQNPNAAIAATSQTFFDVFVGRTANEVVQVRSLVYPWGIRVVRTITMFRTSSGHVFRFDTGWQAESSGVYDFRYNVYDPLFNVIPQPSPYEIHPGIVKGVFQVRNIRETSAVPPFKAVWNKKNGDPYVDDNGVLRTVDGSTPANERSPDVELQPLYFDGDFEIEGVRSGAVGGRVPAKGILGYVQLAPRGEPISANSFAQLLASQFGAIGGPVDCVIDIAGSGQLMRLSRADVNFSEDGAKNPIFPAAARGSVVLPKDGSWSVVQHNQGNGEVSPLEPQAAVPLIRRGRLDPKTLASDTTANDLLRLANPIDLVRPPGANTRNYGLLQSTGTQKALFRLPSFKQGVDQLLSAPPDFADAYRIVNSPGIFPNVQDALPLALGAFQTKILAEGYRLLDPADPAKVFEQKLPEGPLFLINEKFLKIYVEYAKKDKTGTTTTADGQLRYGFDSSAADVGKKWLSKVNDISMVVDLGPLPRLMMIKGKFDAEKGSAPGFIAPELEFSDALQPVIDILQILSQLQGGDYGAALKKGLEVAMSNSADAWSYAFHARKEIPVVKFPPGELYNNPTNPLKLEAHLAIGVYFNEALKVTSDPTQLIPSAGAFLEFGGSVSVMCFSLAAATIYATGAVDLRMAADIKTGPALHMKFGFGAEIVVGLPVVANVSVLYMVGVEIDLDTSQITVSAFLLFRGRAEILGGIVTVTIQIEAKGSVQRLLGSDHTDMIAQVTFGLDISIFLVINLHFSKSWQESRQIA
ncbi:MAG: hypothetical protein QOF89_1128 [Acidobacteriota bacterium]|jgi:hypothetical protein|nr:hypothetical protein [Acidobacteriota bacterium]